MICHLWPNILTNFKFYRRNRLLLLLGLFFLLIWGMFSIPALLFISNRQKFQIIQMVLSQSQWYINLFIAALGVLTVFHHLSSRSYKMVVTKPCLPETWLLSNYLSAMLLSASLHLLVMLFTAGMFLLWRIPFQFGIFYIALDGLCRSAIFYSILSFLTVVIHPFLAVLVILVFNDGLFYQFILLTSAGIKATKDWATRATLSVLNDVLYVFYMVLPAYTPLADKTQRIYSALKVRPPDLVTLGMTLGYALLLSALFYFLSDYSLKKKRLI